MTIANCLLSEPDAQVLIFPNAAAQLALCSSLAAWHLQFGRAELSTCPCEVFCTLFVAFGEKTTRLHRPFVCG